MSRTIRQLVDELPTGGVTVLALQALDFVVPGQWQNLVGFEPTIRAITGEDDPALVRQIAERAEALYDDPNEGYQRAIWLYQTVDSAASAMGAAAMANRLGQDVSFLSFLGNLTPKPERVQSLDLTVKLVVELVAFCQINGLPGDSVADFTAALADYSGESLMRMAALVTLDGLVPLGPDFALKALTLVGSLSPDDLQRNPTFRAVSALLPGSGPAGQLRFIVESFEAVRGWMEGFVATRHLSAEQVIASLEAHIAFTRDKLAYLGAFLDLACKYYQHTGTQTLARRLIERAVAEI